MGARSIVLPLETRKPRRRPYSFRVSGAPHPGPIGRATYVHCPRTRGVASIDGWLPACPDLPRSVSGGVPVRQPNGSARRRRTSTCLGVRCHHRRTGVGIPRRNMSNDASTATQRTSLANPSCPEAISGSQSERPAHVADIVRASAIRFCRDPRVPMSGPPPHDRDRIPVLTEVMTTTVEVNGAVASVAGPLEPGRVGTVTTMRGRATRRSLQSAREQLAPDKST